MGLFSLLISSSKAISHRTASRSWPFRCVVLSAVSHYCLAFSEAAAHGWFVPPHSLSHLSIIHFESALAGAHVYLCLYSLLSSCGEIVGSGSQLVPLVPVLVPPPGSRWTCVQGLWKWPTIEWMALVHRFRCFTLSGASWHWYRWAFLNSHWFLETVDHIIQVTCLRAGNSGNQALAAGVLLCTKYWSSVRDH